MIDLIVQGGVATVRLNHAPVNALSDAFVEAFHRVLDQLDELADVKLIVVDSALRVFSAGADLAQIERYMTERDGPAQMHAYVTRLHGLFDRLEASPKVSLAVLRGTALGGGLELALACDLRIAAAEASLGLPEAKLGMIPGAGGTQRLTRLCGLGTAARIILTAEVIDGQEALRIGLAQWTVARDGIDARVAALAGVVADLSAPALAASKDCIQAAVDPQVDGYARELDKPIALITTGDADTRIRAFFERKRTLSN
jgi:enoyl-CoA hydratase